MARILAHGISEVSNVENDFEHLELLKNLNVGDVYENAEGDEGVLKFGLYRDSVQAYDEYHYGYYIEHDIRMRFGLFTTQSSVVLMVDRGWRKRA